jgi:glutathione S-transferase
MPSLVIIGFPVSTYVRAVRMLCEEKGVPYLLDPAEPHSRAVNALHPYGKVPGMRHGRTELFESKAIATYIDRRFPGRKLLPEDALRAAEAEKWIAFTNHHVYPTMIHGYVIPCMDAGSSRPDARQVAAAMPDIEKQTRILDRALGATGYLAGRGLTFADLNLAPIVNYTRMFEDGKSMIARARNVGAWLERITRRRSWLKTEPPEA